MPKRCAVASTLIVVAAAATSNGAMPSRSRSSLARTVVQVPPSGARQRMRFNVTASSRSGQRPASLRITAAASAVRSG
ncbi:hypothetical protein [Bosea vaviloviae]|uniref:hypothetical protein n=1 Tax=Bosea vaviloviae TaxID=1526658 RepID=UPI0009E9DEAF|nr:hypothetical protein [Bosea vaviloviae]